MVSRRSPSAGPATYIQRQNRLAPSAPVFVPATAATPVASSGFSVPQLKANQQPTSKVHPAEIAGTRVTCVDAPPPAALMGPHHQQSSTIADWKNFGVNSDLGRMPTMSSRFAQQPGGFVEGGTETVIQEGVILTGDFHDVQSAPGSVTTAVPVAIDSSDLVTHHAAATPISAKFEHISTQATSDEVTSPTAFHAASAKVSRPTGSDTDRLNVAPHRRNEGNVKKTASTSLLTPASVLESFGILAPTRIDSSTQDDTPSKRAESLTPELPMPATPEIAPSDLKIQGNVTVMSEEIPEITFETFRGPHHISVLNGHVHHVSKFEPNQVSVIAVDNTPTLAKPIEQPQPTTDTQNSTNHLNGEVNVQAAADASTLSSSEVNNDGVSFAGLIDDRVLVEAILRNFGARIETLESVTMELRGMLERQSNTQ